MTTPMNTNADTDVFIVDAADFFSSFSVGPEGAGAGGLLFADTVGDAAAVDAAETSVGTAGSGACPSAAARS
ncbi:hypothetical protein ONZ45_g10013 [Pleurotus djamor]|nr:hypothetical protein ONZ45_g10013 [Pleurotus djamor]